VGLLTKLNFTLNPLATVVEVVEEWKPRKCTTEKDYEKSLHRFLQEGLEGIDVIPQFGSGRVKGDLVVGKRVLIEVKKDLDSTAKLQRLIGQLDLYSSEWRDHVIIVLCGRHDDNLVRQLQERVKKYSPGSFLVGSPEARLIKK